MAEPILGGLAAKAIPAGCVGRGGRVNSCFAEVGANRLRWVVAANIRLGPRSRYAVALSVGCHRQFHAGDRGESVAAR